MNKIFMLSLVVIMISVLTVVKAPISFGHEGEETPGAHKEEVPDQGKEESEHGREEGSIPFTEQQIKNSSIEIELISGGTLSNLIKVPGKIVSAADKVAKIIPKVEGVVTEAKFNIGDSVQKDQILAVIESKEMAETVAEYLASKRSVELNRTIYQREKTLWDKKVTAEQDFLNARNMYQDAKIKNDLSLQKLQALGQDAAMLKSFEGAGSANKIRFHEVKSPLSGRIIAREVTLGEFVNATHSVYTVADLSVVWIEVAIAPGDLSFVKEGQNISFAGTASTTNSSQSAGQSAGQSTGQSTGRIIFISPIIDVDTRSAKAIIEVDNKDAVWRPGEFVNVLIETSTQDVNITIPKSAIQQIEGKPVVFIRNAEGFEKRIVSTGKEDNQSVEILSGIAVGEKIAVKNTFVLKADLGKSEAEHAH